MSLRILHTADWHIGQTFYGYDRSVEHEHFLAWLISALIDHSIDVLLVSGDVFDIANPSAASQKMFFNFIKKAKSKMPNLQIIITAGNHDSASRLEAPKPLLEDLDITVIGTIPRNNELSIDYKSLLIPLYNSGREISAWCLAVPFLRMGDYPPGETSTTTYYDGILRLYDELYSFAKTKISPDLAVIVMGHLHVQGAKTSDNDKSERTIIGGMEFLPAEFFNPNISYLALGHIHKAQIVANKNHYRYCGSPIPMSFSEIEYNHQVVVFDIVNNSVVNIEEIKIPIKVGLKCIPDFHEPLPNVLQKLEALPTKGSYIGDAPYLEVRILISEIEPSLKHKVEAVLASKHVKFARIDVKYVQEEIPIKSQKTLSFDDFKKLDPIEIANKSYAAKYKSDMPYELSNLFIEIIEEAKLLED